METKTQEEGGNRCFSLGKPQLILYFQTSATDCVT